MKRGIGRLLLAAAMAAQLLIPALAAEEWTVTYDGSGLTGNFTTEDMTAAAGDLQPGDTVSFTVTLKNNSGSDAEWWMKNQVLSSFEDSEKASGGAYSYALTYSGPGGELTLYRSDAVGGDQTEGRQGLHRATGALEDYFYLDSMADGEAGTVTLTVGLEGETEGNAYQNTAAKLALIFAAEPVELTAQESPVPSATASPAVSPVPSEAVSPAVSPVPSEAVSPAVSPAPSAASPTAKPAASPAVTGSGTGRVNTGDETNLTGFAAAAAVSGGLLLILAVWWMRRKRAG